VPTGKPVEYETVRGVPLPSLFHIMEFLFKRWKNAVHFSPKGIKKGQNLFALFKILSQLLLPEYFHQFHPTGGGNCSNNTKPDI
jgi:hypothetical protein